ncbi:MAG: FAD-binding domain-containing protein [Pseudomonadota bacterium]
MAACQRPWRHIFAQMDDLFPNLDAVAFAPSREAGVQRLSAFQPKMGRAYASERNSDYGPSRRTNVSALSPWVRTRTLLEEELVRGALDKFALSTAEKFVQEVCWRTYFKGWMEHRPGVWRAYQDELERQLDLLERNSGLKTAYDEAVEGGTGIDCFDAWAGELVETGYLHNHSRMWFASIWMFTLGLPWELGADFFLRHLMDGDAASNTLSWRWVGGLHTPGKTYLARPSNIRKYTADRFDPQGLASSAEPLAGFDNPAIGPLPLGDARPEGDVAMLLTEEDLNGETLRPAGATVRALAGVSFAAARSPLGVGAEAERFAQGAVADALARAGAAHGCDGQALQAGDGFVEAAVDWARASGAPVVITGYAPTGWVRPKLEGLARALAAHDIQLRQLQRDWDQAFWPHAKRGFFGLKKKIPSVLAELGLPV